MRDSIGTTIGRLYRGYIGSIIPSSLLTTSKVKGEKARYFTFPQPQVVLSRRQGARIWLQLSLGFRV